MTIPVICDNDWSGDPDGLVALAHHLLSPGNEVVAVTSTFLHPMFGSPQSRASDGARLARELVEMIGGPTPEVHAGAEGPLTNGRTPDAGAAADAIIELARQSAMPMTIACGGPLTNVAVALERAPDIAPMLHLVWVGGSTEAAEGEYNRDTDPDAAARVLATPGLRITQFPVQTYRRNEVDRAWLQEALQSRGIVGSWLWQQFADLHLPDFLELGPTWVLGDSLPVLVTAMDEATCTFEATGTGTGASVRICTDHQPFVLVDDLMERLSLHTT